MLKTYLVTNNSEGSICVTGRTRIDIPGLCKDLPLVLPENTARQTISRLKQRYPLLKIREAQENQPTAAKNVSEPEKSRTDTGNGDNSPTGNIGESGNDKNDAVSDKNSNVPAPAAETGDSKSGDQNNSGPNQPSAQKPDNKKGK